MLRLLKWTLILLVTSLLFSLWIREFWIAAPVAFAIGLALGRKRKLAFSSGFLAVALLWLGLALYAMSGQTTHMTDRIADLLGVGTSGLLYPITALLGGLIGGLSCYTGAAAAAMFQKPRRYSSIR